MANSRTAIQTFSGVFVDVFNPDPATILIEDIAHALSFEPRFGGHLRRFWSSAHHGLLVSALVTDEFKLPALMHDASDYACRDLPRPIKNDPQLVAFRCVESEFQRAIERKFGAETATLPQVKYADNIALWAEAQELHHGTDGWVSDLPERAMQNEVDYAREILRGMLELDAKTMFLKQFTVLTGGDVHA